MSLLQRWFGPPSQRRFADMVASELRRQGEKRPATIDHQKFTIQMGDQQVISLANLYAEFCQLPRARRKAYLRGLVRTFLSKEEVPSDFAEARPSLRPKVSLRATVEFLRLNAGVSREAGPKLLTNPLGSHLVSSLAYDMPMAIRSVVADDLEAWGVTYYEAMEAALENLDRSTVAWAKLGDHVVGACTGDNYDSSRILLLERIKSSLGLKGTLIAVVPQRDEVHVTSEDNQEGLRIVAELTAKAMDEQPRLLSPLPLRLVDGEWEDWLPPPDHPSFPKFQELRLNFLGSLYHDQKNLLEALFEKEGRDVFVASFSGMQRVAQPMPVSYCVWIDELPSLLPEADYVTLIWKDQQVAAMARFDDVRRIVGDLIVEDPEFYPRRYFVNGFPTEEQLRQLKDLQK